MALRWPRLWRRHREALPFGGMGLSSPFLKAPRVRKLQERLAARGFDPGPIDGVYGERTAAAVLEAKRRLKIAIPPDTEDRAVPELMGKLGL